MPCRQNRVLFVVAVAVWSSSKRWIKLHHRKPVSSIHLVSVLCISRSWCIGQVSAWWAKLTCFRCCELFWYGWLDCWMRGGHNQHSISGRFGKYYEGTIECWWIICFIMVCCRYWRKESLNCLQCFWWCRRCWLIGRRLQLILVVLDPCKNFSMLLDE